MARVINKYHLTAEATVQAVEMPKRARVVSVGMGEGGPWLFAEVYQDVDTVAFDVRNYRHFVVVVSGGAVPEGAGYVGSCALQLTGRKVVDYHVYEVRPGRSSGT
jgi:hypothetical protein